MPKYGLQSAFSEIERLSHEVTGSGNPISMNLSTRYVVKGIGKEQKIDSVILIHHDGNGKIEKVEDKWDGKLPDSTISNVSLDYFCLVQSSQTDIICRPSAASMLSQYQTSLVSQRTRKRTTSAETHRCSVLGYER